MCVDCVLAVGLFICCLLVGVRCLLCVGVCWSLFARWLLFVCWLLFVRCCVLVVRCSFSLSLFVVVECCVLFAVLVVRCVFCVACRWPLFVAGCLLRAVCFFLFGVCVFVCH